MNDQIKLRVFDTPDGISKLREAIDEAEAIIIGAGAGLSTSAGFEYAGERFARYFKDFSDRYHFHDMYAGGFYHYETLEEQWAFWSRNIFINRYMKAPKPVYDTLYEMVKDKDYFVLTTNVDHQFQKAGFDKNRMFYTQGDYGLWQCSSPCHRRTYDNKSKVVKMVLSQGFSIDEAGRLQPPVNEDGEPDYKKLNMSVPSDLVPYCPVCGEPMSMNLRADDTFVEDEGWQKASRNYMDYLNRHENQKTLFLELAVGFNTPGIIKYNFWKMTNDWPDATYACVNAGEACAPDEIREKSICVNGDVGEILKEIVNL